MSHVAADLILAGGRVFAGGSGQASAVAVSAGRICAVGMQADVMHLRGVGTRVRYLHGATVLPGLVDAHGHVLAHGFALQRLELRDTTSYADLIDRVVQRAAGLPPGQWILGQGWDNTRWPGGAFPHHDVLSRAVPDHPVYLRRIDMHAALVNARAMAQAGLTNGTSAPEGGEIVRDAAGVPSGVLIDNSASLVDATIPSPSRREQRDALAASLRHLASLGLTAVHDAGLGYAPDLGVCEHDDPGWATVDLYRELLASGRLPIRVYAMLGGNFAYPPLGAYFERPPLAPEGDGRLRVRAIKIGVDGALGSRGAALEEPYDDAPGARGLLTRSAAVVEEIAHRALASGWQIAIHAIGDRANRIALDAVAAARRAVPAALDPRPRIEHAQILSARDLPRFRQTGAIASVQPVHATSDHRWVGQRLGTRVAGAYAYASLLRHGAHLACGSDFPVEDPDPLAGLQAAVARCDGAGQPPHGWHAEEGLDLRAAVTAYTRGAAYAAFMEQETGSIATGMRADLTVVDRHPGEVVSTDLSSLSVQMTLVGGDVVFDATTDGPAGAWRQASSSRCAEHDAPPADTTR